MASGNLPKAIKDPWGTVAFSIGLIGILFAAIFPGITVILIVLILLVNLWILYLVYRLTETLAHLK